MNDPLVMPDGRLAPSVLTWREAAALLRLDEKGAKRTLAHYRELGQLRGKKIGREFKYTTKEIKRFLEN